MPTILKAGELGAGMQGSVAGRLCYQIRAAGGRAAFPAEDVMVDLAALVSELLVAESQAEHQRRQYGADAQVDYLGIMSAHPKAVFVADKLAAIQENKAAGLGGARTLVDDGGWNQTVSIWLR